jgi:leader peptidase (prepilin peptidase)/N-methyltransferase
MTLKSRRWPRTRLYLVCGVAFLIESAVSMDAAALLRAAGIAALTLGGFLVLALALPGQLGLGDVVFAGWIVLSLGWFSWRAAVLGLMVGLLVHLVAADVLGLGSSRSRMLPMGPALLAGWVVGLFTTQGWTRAAVTELWL